MNRAVRPFDPEVLACRDRGGHGMDGFRGDWRGRGLASQRPAKPHQRRERAENEKQGGDTCHPAMIASPRRARSLYVRSTDPNEPESLALLLRRLVGGLVALGARRGYQA